MADLAEIGLSVNTRGIRAGQRELDRLADSGDDAQRSFDRFGNELRETDRALGRTIDATGRMREANGRFVTGLQRTTDETRQLNTATNSSTSAFKGAAQALAAYLSVAAGVETIVGFEEAMLGLEATTRATTAEMAAFEQQARELGATSVFSAEQAANAQKFLAQAGFDTNEILSATPDILNLAAAGSLELANAADIASNVLGGMGLQVSELARVSDVMAEAAAASNTNIEQLGEALSTAAPLAATAGVSVEEATAAIGKLSDAGIQGSRAGTGLVGVIRQLSNVTTTGEDALARYGLSVADVNINTNGLANVLGKLEDASLSTADSFAIFGSEAAPAALILADASEEVATLTARLNDAEGSAQEMSDILGGGLSASFKELKSAASEVVLSLGDSGVDSVLQSVVEGVTYSIRGWDALIDELNEFTGAAEKADRATQSLSSSTNDLRVQTLNLADAYDNTSQAQLEAASVRLTILERSLSAELANLEAQDGIIESIQTGLKRDMLANVSGELDLITNSLLRYNNANKAGTKSKSSKGSFSTPTIAAFSSEEKLGVKGYTDEIERLTKAYATTLTPLQQLEADQSSLNNLISIASKDELPALTDALGNVDTEIKSLTSNQIDWEAIGTTGADSIASTLASGDWSGVGDAIGGALSNGIGTALSASLGGGIAGGLAGGLAAGAISSALSGKKKTGSSTSVSVSGGSTSGSTRTNYSGLFGSSSSIEALTSDTLSALDNSVSDSLLTIDDAFSSMGLTVTTGISDFATTVKVGEGEFSDAIEEITDDYIDANFAAIEDYSRAGETFVETFERINEEMVSVIDSFSVGTGSGSFQAAADAYIETQGAIIDASTQSALSSARQGAMEAQAAFDAINPTGSRSRTNSVTGRTNDRTVFTGAEQRARNELQDQIDSYNRIISEQTSRLGVGVQTASVNFSNAVLGTIASIEGISSEDAITRLGQLTAAYESSYFTVTEQLERSIDSAASSLSQFNDLGATTGTSLDEFQEAFERFRTSDAFTPEGYSRYLLAADALAEYQNATESLTEQIKLDAEEQKEAAEEAAKAAGILLEGSDDLKNAFDNINDFVNDLIGLGADGELSLAAASSAYQQTLALAATGNEDALSDLTKDAQNYLDAVTSGATSGSQVDIAQSQVVADLSNLTGTIPAFAMGGAHTGGLRLVGENGPEIEMTGPSNIISNAKSSSMLDNTELTRQVSELSQIMKSGMFAVAKNTNKSYKVLNKWDTQGQPAERVV